MRQDFTEFEIDGTKYLTSFYLVEKSLDLFERLLKVFGEPFVYAMLSGSKAGSADAVPVEGEEAVEVSKTKDILSQMAETPEMIAAAVRSLTDKLGSKLIFSLAADIVQGATIYTPDGKKREATINDFNGRIGHLFKVCIRILQFQFGDVAQGFLGSIAGKRPPAAKPQSGRVKAM